MTYDLYIGDRTFSSWSMRGWLMFAAFDIPFRPKMVGLYGGKMAQDMAPARLVPAMTTPAGHVVQDTLAMAETLAEAHPDAGLWPTDPAARALARGIVCEMHSGFGALREACPMNLQNSWVGFDVSDAVKADLTRIELLWDMARDLSGSDGWLFGDYSLADVFYAPVAARIAGYGLPVSTRAQAYVDHHLNHTKFRQWRAMGLTKTYDPFPYEFPFQRANWPGPAPITAHAVESGTPENKACPYSGDPVTDLMQIGDRTFGFCNPFCRDKTVHDPEAWPAFMDIYTS